MPGLDIDHDEARGGPRDRHNFISALINQNLYKSTVRIWPWTKPGSHEQDNRMNVPSAFVEKLFALAPVPEGGY